jgi:signal-transduction protein with cAMP-binding, CBS, and nucleotidyltransferase domain
MEREKTPVARLMTSGALTVASDAALEDAAQTLLDEGVGSLVVVDESDRPVGMFTTTDLAEFVAEGASRTDATVAEYMTDRVVTIETRSSTRDAAARMIRNGVHHLPVTEDGSVVGMLSTMDLAAYFAYTGGSDMV